MLDPDAIATAVMRARRRAEYQASHCLDNNPIGKVGSSTATDIAALSSQCSLDSGLPTVDIAGA